MKVVIIVTYNAKPWIERCLKSCGDYPAVVVDNASADDTLSFIKNNFPEVTLLEQTKNLGFGQANNIGISYALSKGADYVFLLNQDAYLQPDTINKLIKTHKENKDYGVISPIHLNGKGSKLDKNFEYYLKQKNDLMSDLLCAKLLKPIYNVPFVNAAAWLLPRKTLETVGGFDPLFFHYGEDDNYCQRVLYHDFKIGVALDTFIYHDRENRSIKVVTTTAEKLALRERFLKKELGNINESTNLDMNKIKQSNFILMFKLLLKLKFKKARYYFLELQMIKKLVIQIKKSRTINEVKGSHYL